MEEMIEICVPHVVEANKDMNVDFWKKHQNTSLEDATKMFHKSHRDVLELAEK